MMMSPGSHQRSTPVVSTPSTRPDSDAITRTAPIRGFAAQPDEWADIDAATSTRTWPRWPTGSRHLDPQPTRTEPRIPVLAHNAHLRKPPNRSLTPGINLPPPQYCGYSATIQAIPKLFQLSRPARRARE